MKKKSTGNKITKTNVSVLVSHLSWLLPPTSDRWNCSCTLHFAIWMNQLTIHLYLEVDLQRRRRYNRIETFFHHLLSRLLNSPQKASHLPLLLSQTACFHVLQPCWKTEKELTHEGSSRNSDPQSTTTKHSLTLKGESADLFLLALRSLFFKLKPVHDPDQRTCHTLRPNLWKYGSSCSGRCSDQSLPGHQCNNSSFYCSLSRQVAWENVTLNYHSIELKPPRFCWDFKSGKRQAACKINSQLLVCDWELTG